MSRPLGKMREKDPALAQPLPKLSIPIIPRTCLERPRLGRLFDAALFHKAILVTAPAGYGKTVFLSQALGNVNRPIVWLSLDKRDNHLVRFWGGLITGLQKIQPGLGDNTLAMLRFRKPSIEPALTELVNEIAEALPNVILVLDDYHHLNNQAIHDSLAFLIDYLPPQVRLLISSRVAPPLPLARLRGRGHLAEIKASGLQFTREETYSFLNEVMELDLPEEQIDSLHGRTEGWIAGLQMAAVSMQGRRDAAAGYLPVFKGINREIIEYLNEEVLGQQEEHIRTFLLRTSILDRLTESLCKAVTGRDDSQQILERLVAVHLFLQPLDEEGRWFRYHQLFSDLLRKQLEATQPDIISGLHSRASEWYESQGMMKDAIEHTLAARDFERAADLMRHIAFTMLWQGEVSIYREWITRLPEEFVVKRLEICILGALSSVVHRQVDAGESYRRDVQRMSDALEITGEAGSLEAATTARGFLALTKSLNYLSYYNDDNFDSSKATICLLDGLKSLPEHETIARYGLIYALGVAYWRNGELEASYRYLEEGARFSRMAKYSFIAMHSPAALAHIRFAWGHLNSAAEACRETIHLGTDSDGKESPINCYARLLLGEIFYQWNSLDESRSNVMRAIHLSAQLSEPVMHLNANMALARIAIARGEPDAAMEIVRKAKITHGGDARMRSLADAFLARLWMMAGNVAAAFDYAHASSEFLSTQSSGSTQVNSSASLIQNTDAIQHGIYGKDIRDVWSEKPLLTLIRLRLAQGKLDGLGELLEDVCRDAESRGWGNNLIEALILKAQVLHAKGKLAHALRTLGDVLDMTEKEGYVRIYVDEGLPMYQLLQRAASRGMAPLYISRLLSAFNMPATNSSNPCGKSKANGYTSSRPNVGFDYMTESLTKREIEVLELVAAALPNRDIAKKLSISLYTVKNHLRNIYEKLDVNSRSFAIVRAQKTGLLKATSPKGQWL